MIDLSISLSNPWSTTWRTLFCKGGLLSQHKAWEFNAYRTHYLIDVSVRLHVTGDHPGLFLMLGLLGRAVEVNLYDTRHGDQR